MAKQKKKMQRVAETIEAYRAESLTDPLGMYTGNSMTTTRMDPDAICVPDPAEPQASVKGGKVYRSLHSVQKDTNSPTQDADDL